MRMGIPEIKAKPKDHGDKTYEVCWKCGGNGFYCMGIHNDGPYSFTGFTCYKCNGTGYIAVSKKGRARRARQEELNAEAIRRANLFEGGGYDLNHLKARDRKRVEKILAGREEANQVQKEEENYQRKVVAYEARREARIVAEKTKSKHFGTVRNREEFKLTLKSKKDMEPRLVYGRPVYSTLYRFEDRDGNVAIWFCSGAPLEMAIGETKRVKATVKKHNGYNGQNQTQLIRVKLV